MRRLTPLLLALGLLAGSALAAAAPLTDQQARALAQKALGGDVAALSTLKAKAGSGDAAAAFGLSAYYFAASDRPRSVQWLKQAAEHGHAQAQYNLAEFYALGQGVPKDDVKSAAWLKRAATQGLLKAEVALGLDYVSGTGLPKDYAQAVVWFQKAADKGDPQAEYALGRLYHAGQGVDQDYAKAFDLLQKAADQGETEAGAHLCNDYAVGAGVPVDFIAAYKWCSIALSLAPAASTVYDASRKVMDTIGPSMSPRQIAAAQSQAGDWIHEFNTTKHP